MDSISIHGGVALQGTVRIQGSKNAALPILAASLLTSGENILYNCPRIQDIFQMQQMLKSIGCIVRIRSDSISVDTRHIRKGPMPSEAVRGMRSSLCMLGALLGRSREVIMEYPGGCVIGDRPIDLHLEALGQMGACFEEEDGRIRGYVNGRMHGSVIRFPKVSVGATENVILAAVLAEGVTCMEGAAKEPEVAALCEYLTACGAEIEGAGTDRILIKGVKKLQACSFYIPADRIVAGTYLFGALATGGNILLEAAPYHHMEAVLQLAEKMGADYQAGQEGLYIQAPKKLAHAELIRTEVYPGFPTDLQSMALVASLRADGCCMIEETIFENRFHILEPLKRMGADLRMLDNQHVLVNGPVLLTGAEAEAKELRGGAALILAGLMAEGITTVTGCKYIMRGYENICKDLRELGARIVSV